MVLSSITEWFDQINVQIAVAGNEVPETLSSNMLCLEVPVTDSQSRLYLFPRPCLMYKLNGPPEISFYRRILGRIPPIFARLHRHEFFCALTQCQFRRRQF